MEQLNPKEQILVNEAINELVQQGLVTTDNRNGTFCVVLTEKGFDHIYPIKENEVINKIGSAILFQFAKLNSKVNHIIDERWIHHNLMKTLNPKEQILVNEAINELVQQGLVTKDNRNGAFCVVLTEKGFNEIY
jgi:predicted transcriptional regulator